VVEVFLSNAKILLMRRVGSGNGDNGGSQDEAFDRGSSVRSFESDESAFDCIANDGFVIRGERDV